MRVELAAHAPQCLDRAAEPAKVLGIVRADQHDVAHTHIVEPLIHGFVAGNIQVEVNRTALHVEGVARLVLDNQLLDAVVAQRLPDVLQQVLPHFLRIVGGTDPVADVGVSQPVSGGGAPPCQRDPHAQLLAYLQVGKEAVHFVIVHVESVRVGGERIIVVVLLLEPVRCDHHAHRLYTESLHSALDEVQILVGDAVVTVDGQQQLGVPLAPQRIDRMAIGGFRKRQIIGGADRRHFNYLLKCDVVNICRPGGKPEPGADVDLSRIVGDCENKGHGLPVGGAEHRGADLLAQVGTLTVVGGKSQAEAGSAGYVLRPDIAGHDVGLALPAVGKLPQAAGDSLAVGDLHAGGAVLASVLDKLAFSVCRILRPEVPVLFGGGKVSVFQDGSGLPCRSGRGECEYQGQGKSCQQQAGGERSFHGTISF